MRGPNRPLRRTAVQREHNARQANAGCTVPVSVRHLNQDNTVLPWIWISFLLSVITGVIGLTSTGGAIAEIAEGLFYLFLVIFAALLLFGRRAPPA